MDKLVIELTSMDLPSNKDPARVSLWIVQLDLEEDAKVKLPKIRVLANDYAE